MTLPGENLLIKMWETLVEKGIGGLLRPWQIGREAKVQLETRQMEIVGLAEAQREAEDIKSGRRDYREARFSLVLEPQRKALGMKERIEPRLDALPVIEMAAASIIGDSICREVNVAKAIIFAESELKDDPQEPPEQKVDSDWLFRWREYAGSISSNDLQNLWGRLLAGEVKSPGSFSYRALELLRNLSVDEAKRIERLSRFVIDDFVVRSQSDLLRAEGLNISELLDMQDLGVITGVEALGLTRTKRSVLSDSFTAILCSHGRALVLKHPNPKIEVPISIYLVTSVGKQILRLGKFSAHEAYLRAVGEEIKKSHEGISVEIANCRDRSTTEVEYFDEQAI